MPGVVRVLTAADVPGENDTGPILHDEPLIPADRVSFYGQAVAWVVAIDEASARAAAAKVEVDYTPLAPCLTIADAIAREAFHLPPVRVARGDAATALDLAAHRACGEVTIGGQDHFYLETQTSWVQLDADGLIQITSSTQHPTETQIIVARVLGIPSNRVVCRCLRMGGGFGGKETQANPVRRDRRTRRLDHGTPCAHQAVAPARHAADRQTPSVLRALRGRLRRRRSAAGDGCGHLCRRRLELRPVAARAHARDGTYRQCVFLPACRDRRPHREDEPRLEHRVPRLRRTAGHARRRGNPRAHRAPSSDLPADRVRERNFYRDDGEARATRRRTASPSSTTHLPELWQQLKRDSEFDARRRAIAQFNAAHAHTKRGVAITPVKFGISFNKTEYNQAGALVHIYTDGSIQLNHGGTEMGQGLHTKMLAVASRVLGVDSAQIRVMPTSTDKVPNTSATAASSSSTSTARP